MMNSTGWIKIHRQITQTSFYRHSATVHLFVHLLIKANHQNNRFLWGGKEVVIEAGQLVTGRKQLSEETGISQQSIRTALVNLKSTNTITIRSTTKFSVITINNWKQYQEPTIKLTNNQPTTNQQPTTNKNDKNDKNVKNNTVLMDRITKWAYHRAAVNPSCSEESFRRSLGIQLSRVGPDKIYKLFEKSDNAIKFLVDIKHL